MSKSREVSVAEARVMISARETLRALKAQEDWFEEQLKDVRPLLEAADRITTARSAAEANLAILEQEFRQRHGLPSEGRFSLKTDGETAQLNTGDD